MEDISDLVNGNRFLEYSGDLYKFIGIEDGSSKTMPLGKYEPTINRSQIGDKGDYIFSDISDGHPVWIAQKELLTDRSGQFALNTCERN